MTATVAKSIATEISHLKRVLDEGYGPGAWHGPDLKAAITGVTQAEALKRPAAGRHNVAEIALHHAYCLRSVRAQLSGVPAEPFVVEGEDWFPVESPKPLSWSKIQAAVESEQERLAALVDGLAAGRARSPLTPAEQFGLMLGITCHAVYHAGQIQLVKKLAQ